MALFGKTVHRKLLRLLLLVGFGPTILALAYNYSIFSLGFETVLGTFLQDRAESAASKIDAALQYALSEFATTRSGLSEGEPLESAGLPALGVIQQYALLDRRGAVLAANPATSETRVEILPGVMREESTTGPILINESVTPDMGSRLILQAALDPEHVLTAFVSPGELLKATGEMMGSSFLRVYSNRAIFPGQTDDSALRDVLIQHDNQVRDKLSGWFAAGQRRQPGGTLVGFAESRMLRMRRNEGATTVEWLVLARMDVQEVSSLLSYMLWHNVLLGLLLAPLLVGLSYLLARRFVAPVRVMHKQALRVARGDLDARVDVHTGDELELLANAFNSMTESLRSSRESLEKYLQSVERKARQISLESTITRKLVGPFDFDQLGQATHEELKPLLAYDALSLVVFAAGETPARRFSFIADVFAGCADEEVQSVCENAFAHQTPGFFPSALRMESPPVKALADLQYDHCCVVPLRGEAGLAGVLALARRGGADFSAEECSALEQIAGVLAIGIEHIALYERTRSFALELEQKVEERAGELQRAQEQLFRVERFAATGRLAANIAHEINNPLGVIKNYLHLFRQKQPQMDDTSSEALKIVQEELDRIARIVRNLLDFYKPGAAVPENLAINEEIGNLMPLLEPGFRKRQIRLNLELEDGLPAIQLPRDHLRQVLLNLLKNAEDAVDNGGQVTVRTGLVDEINTARIMLEVSDNGCGIPVEDHAQIFEPFFTRKREGQPQGTGLGLAVTYGIVQSAGGSIEIESKPGAGTSIRISLPCVGPPNCVPKST
jgi:signal transduction histidine kinase